MENLNTMFWESKKTLFKRERLKLMFHGRIGGNSDLSPMGEQYASLLANYINKQNIPG